MLHLFVLILIACGLPAAVEVPTTTEAPICTSDAQCVLVVADKRCELGPSDHLSPILVSGGHCTCNAGSCDVQWFEPVQCDTWRDCDVSRDPRLRPVRANPPRTQPIEPCVDAEVDAICDETEKTCRVLAWRC